MQVCNYCGRFLKNEYASCPGCGSTTFKKVSDFSEKVIKTPPEGGYKINTESYEKAKKGSKIVQIIGWVFMAFMLLFEVPFILGGIMSMDVDKAFGFSFITISLVTTIPFVAIGAVMVIIGKKNEKKAINNIERVHKLAKEGMLVKNMPYELIPTGTIINNQPVYCFQVTYENASGQQIHLKSEGKYNNKLSDKDGTVDLLIDPNDFTNYYIDLEIY